MELSPPVDLGIATKEESTILLDQINKPCTSTKGVFDWTGWERTLKGGGSRSRTCNASSLSKQKKTCSTEFK